MLREKQREALPAWLERAQASSLRELRQFAQSIERDRAVVEPVEALYSAKKVAHPREIASSSRATSGFLPLRGVHAILGGAHA
jgi:hypothetical protein